MTNDKSNPCTTSLAYREMQDRWDLICAVAGGTETMRKAKKHLPRHHMEPAGAYTERLNRAVFFNMFSLTVDYLVGKPFAEPVKLTENTSETIIDIAEDIDLQGNDLNQYCQMWFKTALQKGHSHTLIETPITQGEGVVTMEDQRLMNLRPYWVHIEPDNLIAAEATRINGKEVLTHIRFTESEIERDGFNEVEVEYVKQLEIVDPSGTTDPDSYRVELTRWRKGEKGSYAEVERRITDLKNISLVTFYTDREDFMVSKPPLLDLAYLNISHWQSESDQLATLTVSRFPMLAASGVTEFGDQDGGRPSVVVGPHAMLTSEDPGGRFYYVEHSGAALAAGEKHAEHLEARMALYGAQLLKSRPDRETATSRSLDEAASIAPLQRMTLAFLDMLNVALGITAELMGEEFTGQATMKTDFALAENEVTNLQTLVAVRKDREISRLTTLQELKRRNVLPDSYDPEQDLEQLKKEQDDLKDIESPNSNSGNSSNSGDNSDDDSEPGGIRDNPNNIIGRIPAKTE